MTHAQRGAPGVLSWAGQDTETLCVRGRSPAHQGSACLPGHMAGWTVFLYMDPRPVDLTKCGFSFLELDRQ